MSRPSARKREKKVAREQKARTKVAARRERLQAAREAAAAPDPRRNLHVDRGRQVVVNDITPYARAKCGKCKGRGIVATATDAEGKATSATPCRCAHVRFMKANPGIIVDELGAAWWPREMACGCTPESVCAAHEKPNQSAGPGDYQTVKTDGQPLAQRETRPPQPGEKDEPVAEVTRAERELGR